MKHTGGLIYRAGGGSIFKPKGTDTVPAMLTPGEFVIRRSAVKKIGVNNLTRLNNGSGVIYRAGGGAVPSGGGVGIDVVLSEFTSVFTQATADMTMSMDRLAQGFNNLANIFSQGMTINHNFTGDMTLAFNIQNKDAIVAAVATGITPKITEIITQQIDAAIQNMKQEP